MPNSAKGPCQNGYLYFKGYNEEMFSVELRNHSIRPKIFCYCSKTFAYKNLVEIYWLKFLICHRGDQEKKVEGLSSMLPLVGRDAVLGIGEM